jgi:hypothetical protein
MKEGRHELDKERLEWIHKTAVARRNIAEGLNKWLPPHRWD